MSIRDELLRRAHDEEIARRIARSKLHPALQQPNPFATQPPILPAQVLRQIHGRPVHPDEQTRPTPSHYTTTVPKDRFKGPPKKMDDVQSRRSGKKHNGRGQFRNRPR